jgi:alkylated DNA nucleotide flippase Atl1
MAGSNSSLRDAPGYRERVYQLVLRIPKGHVMSYGLVARVLGEGYDARVIGYIMPLRRMVARFHGIA